MSGNRPLSFKEMSFPPSRYGKTAIYAPLPPQPSPRVISSQEKERRSFQFQELKKFANEQRCPLCESQLDGTIGHEDATLYCAANGEAEYIAKFRFGMEVPIWSKLTIYCTDFAIETITNHLDGDIHKNIIFKLDLSLNKRYQQIQKKELFSYEGKPFILDSDLSEQKILQKIKIYTCFS